MSLEHLKSASDEMIEQIPRYTEAKRYYDGDDASSDYVTRMFAALANAGDDFTRTVNVAKIPVDTLADRLKLLAINGPSDAITKQIDELWTANKMQLRFNQFILDVLTYGEYYISVWPEDSDDTDEVSDFDPSIFGGSAPLNHKAKFMFCDPLTTRAFYDEGGELIYTARKWEQKDVDGEPIVRMNLYYNTYIEKYWWYLKDDIKTAMPWYDSESSEWPMENPYGKNPIFHFSTSFPHGQPEHRALYGVQDALNKIFQIHISSIEHLGFPTVYALMDPTSAAGTSGFGYDPIDNTDNDASSDVNRLRNAPGEVWALNATSVGQLKPAGSNDFIQSLKTYKEMAAELSQLPVGLFMSTDGQHPSASAQNAADATLNQRGVDRSVMLSETLKDMISFSVLLAYGIEIDINDLSIQWRPQKMAIDKDVVEVLKFKMSLGIPVEQILTEMGYTPAEIKIFAPSIAEQRDILKDAQEAGLENAAKAKKTSGNSSDSENEKEKEDSVKTDKTSSENK